jgi:hypothetical protein
MSEQKKRYDAFLAIKTEWEQKAAEYNTAYNDRKDAEAASDAVYLEADARCKRLDHELTLLYIRMGSAYDALLKGGK